MSDEAIYHALFLASPDALLLVASDGTIERANPAAASLLGYEAHELAGLSVDTLVPDSIRPQHAALRADYAHAPRPRPMGTQMDLVARRRDGTDVRVEIALSPLLEQGLPYVLASIRNVGEYPRVKHALRQAAYSEQVAGLGALAVDSRDPQVLLQRVPEIAASGLQASSACIYLSEADRLSFKVAGGVGLAGHAGLGELMANVDEWLSQSPGALSVSINDRGRRVGILAVWSAEARTWDDDERRFAQSLANLLASSLQRAQTEEALQHAQRLEGVGQLTGGVAHDFNNLLTVIQGNLQVLQDHPTLADDPNGQQMIAAAMRASSRAAELTSKLLAFSRRQMLRPSAVDVLQLLEALADMLRRTLDGRIRITVLAAPGLQCLADAGQLESALLNIAINARDAMPEGGALSFTCQGVSALPAECRAEFAPAPAAAPKPLVAIHVSDTGTGMPASVKERAFEPFFTTKPAGRGTGLGLSTVYGFARQSQGAVAIDSQPGLGTTVSLFLPEVTRPLAQPAKLAPSATFDIPAGLPVLLVEDEAEVRRIVQVFLKAAGCQVISASSAEEATAQLPKLPDHALLLSDVALGPGMRGTELARLALARLPARRVLLMSGYASQLLSDADSDESTWPLLRKPFTREELLHRIACLLSQPVDPAG